MPWPMHHWVCFDCRKQFRKPVAIEAQRSGEPEATAEPAPCPECRRAMVDMGKYFRPPRRRDRRNWEQLRRLAVHGFRFHRESLYGWLRFALRHTSGKVNADVLIANCSCQVATPGEVLLRAIAARRSGR